MKPSLLIGIDVGGSGGIAWKYADGQIAVEKMPATEADICDLISGMNAWQEPNATAYIEKVTGYIPGRPQPASRMFNFGRNVGVLMGALYCAKIRICEITPRQWQKEMAISLDPKATDTVRKNKLKSEAQKLFPQLKITLSTADALLIYEAGRRIESRHG